ncbi:MAG: carboxypeptidase regulatory-like domain-containing protein [Anaerolineae bacterium]|nr:carboxypeptidase regulatory-like domain-containing protein [Anaerolineae bacterium]NUQ03946.1 carboxypeptidase regulatory-like domain-containing protein [Anaerolineae bacterium]
MGISRNLARTLALLLILIVGSPAALSAQDSRDQATGIPTSSPTGAIQGTVSRVNGTTPIPQVALLLYSASDVFLAEASSAEDGSFGFDLLPPGDYKLWAVPPAEYLPAFYNRQSRFAAADLLTIPPEGGSLGITVMLERWGTISGRVQTQDDGAPIPFAKIDVWTVGGGWVASEIADAAGGYRLSRLAPGDYRVSASAKGFRPAFHALDIAVTTSSALTIETIQVEEGGETSEIDIFLMTDSQAQPVAGDANGDRRVDITDFSMLAMAFGAAAGEAAYLESADFDGDGRIEIGDFSILAENFGSGEPLSAETLLIEPLATGVTPGSGP